MSDRLTVRFENGVFVPVQPVSLSEQEYVIEVTEANSLDEIRGALRGWDRVYEGLSEDEIDEVERIALDLARFMDQAETR